MLSYVYRKRVTNINGLNLERVKSMKKVKKSVSAVLFALVLVLTAVSSFVGAGKVNAKGLDPCKLDIKLKNAPKFATGDVLDQPNYGFRWESKAESYIALSYVEGISDIAEEYKVVSQGLDADVTIDVNMPFGLSVMVSEDACTDLTNTPIELDDGKKYYYQGYNGVKLLPGTRVIAFIPGLNPNSEVTINGKTAYKKTVKNDDVLIFCVDLKVPDEENQQNDEAQL